ncbi:MAG: DUF268 domain-containing protein [Bacteroidota bacterium]|nr:DUF268 domain-containing protein [Bacteroidota bacterium]MDP3144473.1 DUF268 domain-containing protein [Bacteroidota bacterium]MDP3555849.1 DUF268 domain-containing protein [Bacteroidota bacterium]
MLIQLLQYLLYKKSAKKIWPDFKKFIALESRATKRFSISKNNFRPQLEENSSTTNFDRHYTYHPAWAARILKEINPTAHIDISSTVNFSTIVSAFIPISFYDYRPAEIVLPNLSCDFQDLCKLTFEDNSIESLSCMHTVEHVGLGRYGDALNYDGDLIAMKELSRVLKANGNLLFVVPIGSESKIYFNAHRVYTKNQIEKTMFDFGLSLKEFTLIPELGKDGGLVKSPSEQLLNKQTYACGCFWFTKK